MVNKKYVFVLCAFVFTFSCCSKKHRTISSHSKVYHLKNGTYGIQNDGDFFIYYLGSDPYNGSNTSLTLTSSGRWVNEGKITPSEKEEIETEQPVEEIETTETATESDANDAGESSDGSDGGGSDGGDGGSDGGGGGD